VEPVIAWYRRDLRVDDNPMLDAVRRTGRPVRHLFVLDPRLLQGPRAPILEAAVADLGRQLAAAGERLEVRHGRGEEEVPRLAHDLGAAVHATEDLTPFALRRDGRVADALGRGFTLHPDDVCVPHDLVGRPRTFSAYARRVDGIGVPRPPGAFAAPAAVRAFAGERLARYGADRDRLDDEAVTAHVSHLLHLGTVSIRRLVALADDAGAAKWRSELLWRDWFRYVLWCHPDLADHAVDRRFDAIAWRDDDRSFEAARRASASSTPACASWRRRASCRTGCGWSARASSSSTCCSTGAAASAGSGGT
jgi:deoxyribodipyrimidine photo-lyase